MRGDRSRGPAVGRRLLLALVATAMVGVLSPLPPAAGDGGETALGVLPPGQGRHPTATELFTGTAPPHTDDQLEMYSGIVRAGQLENEDLPTWFKDLALDPRSIQSEYSPRAGVEVRRDAFGVPFVTGSTRADTMFGAGYVSAEDRLFMMDILRHLGRGRISELLGASPDNLATDRATRLLIDYSEEELQGMLDDLQGEVGNLVRDDLDAFADGVNAFIVEAVADPSKLPGAYEALGILPDEWRPTDTVAVGALIGGQFSPGGAGQLRNAALLRAIQAEGFAYDEKTATGEARQILADLRFPNDPEAPVSTTEEFPLNDDLFDKVDAEAVALPDDPQAATAVADASVPPPTIDGPFGPIRIWAADTAGASNAVLVGPSRSSSGKALAVMGPQIGYFTPEIFMEIGLRGPGILARGGAFPGLSMYVLIGRGADYAWSATTAIGDHNDIRAVRLCDPDDPEAAPDPDAQHYLDDDQCVAMEVRTDTWVARATPGGLPDPTDPGYTPIVSMTTERTRHGIVQGRGTVAGRPVAWVRQRSSYFRDADATLTFAEVIDPARVGEIEDLIDLFGRFSTSFNWHFVMPGHIAFSTTGLYPVLAEGVDPDLPFWGDSEWDWQGFLEPEERPHAIDPGDGVITNWNNKQAPRFTASDDNYFFGPVTRKQLLDEGLAALDGVDLAAAVHVAIEAATRDLRGSHVFPVMLETIGATGDPRLDGALTLLGDWHTEGAHRRDQDGDGAYDDAPAVALMDAWWPRAVEAIFGPVLGEALEAVPLPFDDPPGAGGSAYLVGWYGQVDKDLRTILGDEVEGALSRVYCGAGDLDACRTALVDSLDEAVAELETTFGTDPSTWEADEESDMIRFESIGGAAVDPIFWQNRPTFHIVLEF